MLARIWDTKRFTGSSYPPDAEEEFIVAFNAGKRRNDVASAVISLALLLGPMAALDKALFAGAPLLHAAASIAINGSAIALAMRARSRWFLQHRGWVMAGLQAGLVLSYSAFVIPSTPLFNVLHPLELPAAPGARAGALLYFALLLVSTAFSHVAPMRSKVVLMEAALAVCLLINARRCVQEVNGVPGQGAVYASILSQASAWASKTGMGFLGAPGTGVLGPAELAEGLDEYGACLAVHASLELAVGMLLPMAVLSAEEALARAAFEREFGLGPAFAHGPTAAMVYSLALVPLEVAVGFQAVTAGVGALQRLGLLGAGGG